MSNHNEPVPEILDKVLRRAARYDLGLMVCDIQRLLSSPNMDLLEVVSYAERTCEGVRGLLTQGRSQIAEELGQDARTNPLPKPPSDN